MSKKQAVLKVVPQIVVTGFRKIATMLKWVSSSSLHFKKAGKNSVAHK